MQNTENKTKKFVVLATYVVAVLCLLAGLFLPLFNGKDILAFQLPEVFKSLLNKGNPDAKYAFTLPYKISLFGIESLKFDFMALVIALYAVVTALALLAFIPVAFSVRGRGKAAKKFYYGIEIAAIIVLALYFTAVVEMMIVKANTPPFISSVPYYYVANAGYNMVVAAGGTAIALIALCGMDKGKTAGIKIVLFLLSLIGFAALFDIGLLSEKLAAPFNGKLSSAMSGNGSGSNYLSILFASNISDSLGNADIKQKLLIIAGVVTATVVLLNFFIDTVKLATRKDRKFGRIFDIARYALELVAAACVLVMTFVCKFAIGLMLIVILAVAALQLIIVIIRFVAGLRGKRDEKAADYSTYEDEPVHNVIDIDVTEDEYKAEEPAEQFYDDGYTSPEDDGYRLPEEDYAEHPEEPVAEMPEATEEHQTVEQPAEEVEQQPEPEAEAQPEEEITRFYEPEQDTSYLLPVEQPAAEEPAEETIEEVEEPEAVTEEPVAEEPAEEVKEDIVVEVEKIEEQTDGFEELVQKPYHEEIKPYNPYERHNNPFRAYEQSSQAVQPYNPYAQQTTKPAPVQEQKPVQHTYERPVQEQKPVQHTYERPVQEQKPVQTYKPYEPAAERPQGVRPLQPRPIIQEFKPVPPVSEQPPKEPHVYTIDTIYAGPTDDFIRKLSNDERIEFARTFIEKNRGDLGNIPDYTVGGDNKKFFSVAFIYLGRIRGLVSDGLLNKMYKELNLL